MNGTLVWRTNTVEQAGTDIFPEKQALIDDDTIDDPDRVWQNQLQNINTPVDPDNTPPF